MERFFPVTGLPYEELVFLELFFPVPADSVDWVDEDELLLVLDCLVLGGDAGSGEEGTFKRAALANFQMSGLGFPRFFSVVVVFLNTIQ